MNTKPMTIKQACKLLGLENEHQLAKKLDCVHQTIRYWRKEKKGRLPRQWAMTVTLLAQQQAATV